MVVKNGEIVFITVDYFYSPPMRFAALIDARAAANHFAKEKSLSVSGDHGPGIGSSSGAAVPSENSIQIDLRRVDRRIIA